MNFKVLICDRVHKKCAEVLRKAGFEVEVRDDVSAEELKSVLKNFDGIILRGKTKLTGDILEDCGRLKVIVRAGVGLDNIDVRKAEVKGIKVYNTGEATAQSVAELTFGLILAVARKIPYADSSVKRGEWIKSKLTGTVLSGKTLGVIGFGRIGSKVAKIGKAFGMNVMVYDALFREVGELAETKLKEALNDGFKVVLKLEDLLAESDVITIHIPLTEDSKMLIGEKEFNLMRKKPILINTSRGGIVDEEVLYKALIEGKISGVGLDVYSEEPPKNLKMLNHPNVVCTPHIGCLLY
ncbi:MAG: NAD(P)-binding domain-containing protein, partial [Candidatus Bathyarchaeota archaeon]|nr:NAD(P)-binding domain-containing protein [Candidatus Bathyarchaeota archaeon]